MPIAVNDAVVGVLGLGVVARHVLGKEELIAVPLRLPADNMPHISEAHASQDVWHARLVVAVFAEISSGDMVSATHSHDGA